MKDYFLMNPDFWTNPFFDNKREYGGNDRMAIIGLLSLTKAGTRPCVTTLQFLKRECGFKSSCKVSDFLKSLEKKGIITVSKTKTCVTIAFCADSEFFKFE